MRLSLHEAAPRAQARWHDALRVALRLNSRPDVEAVFAACAEPQAKKQLGYLLARWGADCLEGAKAGPGVCRARPFTPMLGSVLRALRSLRPHGAALPPPRRHGFWLNLEEGPAAVEDETLREVRRGWLGETPVISMRKPGQ